MLLTQCEDVASELHLWEMSYPRDFSRASGLTIWLYYLPAFTLLLLLDTHPRAHKPFVQSCRFFHNTSRHWPACDAVLKGLKAVSQQTGTTLPQACELYLEGANKDGKLDDFPLTWRVMEETEMTEILSDDARDSEPIGVELGLLISRWSAHSLN